MCVHLKNKQTTKPPTATGHYAAHKILPLRRVWENKRDKLQVMLVTPRNVQLEGTEILWWSCQYKNLHVYYSMMDKVTVKWGLCSTVNKTAKMDRIPPEEFGSAQPYSMQAGVFLNISWKIQYKKPWNIPIPENVLTYCDITSLQSGLVCNCHPHSSLLGPVLLHFAVWTIHS